MERLLYLSLALFALGACVHAQKKETSSQKNVVNTTFMEKIQKTEAEWRKELDDMQFCVLRQKGTERAFTGLYWNNHRKGTYYCAGCRTPLFHSSHKFDSGTGWPSFFQAYDKNVVETELDRSHGMIRTEVHCAKCNGHLGHLFEDGPHPTGLRYCINSAALVFKEE